MEPISQPSSTVGVATDINNDEEQEDLTITNQLQTRQRNQSIIVVNQIHCLLLKNINCWTGILVYLLCIFLTIISIFYALGQITHLELDDFFCPPYTAEDVRQNSIAKGLNGGEPYTCFSTKSFRVKYIYKI